MEYKYYGEDKNIYQPRPTSSTSSDADFNYLAGCGLPTDIFEPSNVSNPSNLDTAPNLQNIKHEHKEQDIIEDSCVVLGPSVIQTFDVVNNTKSFIKNETQNVESVTTVSRHSNITFAFGPSQWAKEKLHRKHLTSSVGCRFKLRGNQMNLKGRIPKIIVGKRMGTPRGITSDLVTVENSCSLMTFIK
jgi:hypothetical protein